MKIAVFVSGGGTNLQAIIDNTKDGILKDIEIVLVLSSSKDAYALERAANNGIPSAVVSRKDFASIEEWDDAVVKAVENSGAELVVLAGYLSLLGPKIVSKYSNRIINIHPALLPKYGGKGMYGRHIHEAVRLNNETETGITIHYVSNVCDSGEIIFQAKTPVLDTDTPDDIAMNIHKLEQRHFPKVIEQIIKEL